MNRRAIVVAAALAAAACTQTSRIEGQQAGLASFEVRLVSPDPEAGLLPTSQTDPVAVEVELTALDGRGEPVTFDSPRPVGVSIELGRVEPAELTLPPAGTTRATLAVRGGMGDQVILFLDRGTSAMGVTPALRFTRPTLANVQRPLEGQQDSPYNGRYARVRDGNLVVTNTLGDGFYVTDAAAEEPAFAHLYIYSYRNPDGVVDDEPQHLRPGMRLKSLAGNVSEFLGFTELSFPLVEICCTANERDAGICKSHDDDDNRCTDRISLPAPVELDGRTIRDNAAMEGLEAALVVAAGVVPNFNPTDHSHVGDGFAKYEQWPVEVGADATGAACVRETKDKPCVLILSSENASDIDPLALRGKHVRVTGTVRHVVPTYPQTFVNVWIVEPRSPDDIEELD